MIVDEFESSRRARGGLYTDDMVTKDKERQYHPTLQDTVSIQAAEWNFDGDDTIFRTKQSQITNSTKYGTNQCSVHFGKIRTFLLYQTIITPRPGFLSMVAEGYLAETSNRHPMMF
ncbi:hypothetical protein TWF730_007924 [Orbilia blumenaviensis]|uniref:Uncharacterized protein n=1 Tax=Orbilia blumenaviensis TaxID=1796055 RepID=A0AAV9V9S5_9PEZI